MKRLPLTLLLFIVLAGSLSAQDKSTTAKLKTLDAFVQKTMADWKVQGLSIAIVKKDKVILAKGYGYRDVANKIPVTENTQFAIGSCSKAFTAAAVCQTAQDGLIELDKPVKNYLPSFKLFDPTATEQMTARDLLSHRSGLPRHDLLWYGTSLNRQELFDRLQHLEPNQPFRAVWQYQNLMFMTAGYLVEQMNHTSWEDYVRTRIFQQLEMKNSNFSIKDLEQSADHSLGYVKKKDKVEVIPYSNIDAIGPAGSINSTATDMSHWLVALINGGKYNGKQVLSAQTVREVQTPAMIMPATVPLPYDEGFYNSYGLAWMITSYRGHVRVEHGGNIDGFSASTCFFPKDSLGVVVLTNMNGTGITSIIRNNIIDRMLGLSEVDWNGRMLGDVKKAEEAAAKVKKEEDANRIKNTRPSHDLKDYAGTFTHPAYGDITFALDGDTLRTEYHKMKIKLRHYHYDYFELVDENNFEGEKINFITGENGQIEKAMIRLEPAVKAIEFVRKSEIKKLSKDQLSLYTGDYDFGGAVAKVYLKGDSQLMLLVPGQPDYELEAVKEHEFKLKGMSGFSIRFTVVDNKVTELASVQPNGTFKARKK
ncbi:MAG: serine hydrolase [Cyclobacteriaceae bacterium]|nr:serine hydrolase [Cyclobacteriaceae bacterium]